jgi:hypothetical protein
MRTFDDILRTHGAQDSSELRYLAITDIVKHENAGTWDYERPMISTSIKDDLCSLDWSTLPPSVNQDALEIIRNWHSRALSTAIWKYRDRIKSQALSAALIEVERLLEWSEDERRFSQLLWHLSFDRIDAATEVAASYLPHRIEANVTKNPDDAEIGERISVIKTLEAYRAGKFFKA